MNQPLLAIRNLCVDYVTSAGPIRALDGVSFDVHRGETVGVTGESGCGKTTFAQAVLRILPPPAVITDGQVLCEGRDLLTLDEAALRDLRWRRISMVFQSAMDSLNPVISIGEQIVDTIRAHQEHGKVEPRERALELLDLVGIPRNRIDDFAHQLSGGMRQRVGIALALALEPALVILDEPTTALDVIVEREILGRIRELQQRLGFSVLLITHDLARMLQVSDRIAVFYAARLAEIGPARVLRSDPRHPYTQGLLRAFPSVSRSANPPESIPGSPPSLSNPPAGCRFHPRCPLALDLCREAAPPGLSVGEGHVVWCHRAAE